MRYLEVSVAQSPGERNPMHQFVVEHDAYGPARLLHREAGESSHAMLVHVEGPTDRRCQFGCRHTSRFSAGGQKRGPVIAVTESVAGLRVCSHRDSQ